MPKRLRPEARPAKWTELNEQQRLAFAEITAMIHDALEDLPKVGTERQVQTESITRDGMGRTSRTAFVSGDRGTGKTTVLYSLKRESNVTDEYEYPKEMDPAVQNHLSLLRQRVVWLADLDLEPIQEPPSLLMAIMARIEDSLNPESLARPAEPDSTDWPLFDPTRSGQDALMAFKRLQRNIAVGWDSNLGARKAHLDPDVYAAELMESELARLTLGRELDQVLDGLARQTAHGAGKRSPLFILPVDDLDLNPPACLPLLRMLRLLSSPRLFMLILGDERLTELVINLQLSNDLAGLGREIRDSNQLSVPATQIAYWAGNVAANAMRKLLPPEQRVYLRKPQTPEALNFRPLDAGDDPRLHELFAECPVKLGDHLRLLEQHERRALAWPKNYVSLRGLLLQQVSPRSIEDSAEEPDTAASTPRPHDSLKSTDASRPRSGPLKMDDLKETPYSGIHFVRVPLRRLVDLWMAIREIALETRAILDPAQPAKEEDRPGKDERLLKSAHCLVELFARKARNSLVGEPVVLPEAREEIRKAIVQREGGKWELRRLPVRVESDTAVGVTCEPGTDKLVGALWRAVLQSLEERGDAVKSTGGRSTAVRPDLWADGLMLEDLEQEPPELMITALQHTQWLFRAGASSADTPTSGGILSSGTGCELTVLHDLLALGEGGEQFSSPLLDPSALATGWIQTEWNSGGGSRTLLPWPLPPCYSFWELDRFLALLKKAQEEARNLSGEMVVNYLAFAWIAGGTSSLDQLETPCTSPDRPDWPGLFGRLESLADQHRDRVPKAAQVNRWLLRVALLLMPEYGLPSKLRTEAPFRDKLKSFLQSRGQVIRELRVEGLASLVRNGMPALAEVFASPRWTLPLARSTPPHRFRVYQQAGIELERGNRLWLLRPEKGRRSRSKQVRENGHGSDQVA